MCATVLSVQRKYDFTAKTIEYPFYEKTLYVLLTITFFRGINDSALWSADLKL